MIEDHFVTAERLIGRYGFALFIDANHKPVIRGIGDGSPRAQTKA